VEDRVKPEAPLRFTVFSLGRAKPDGESCPRRGFQRNRGDGLAGQAVSGLGVLVQGLVARRAPCLRRPRRPSTKTELRKATGNGSCPRPSRSRQLPLNCQALGGDHPKKGTKRGSEKSAPDSQGPAPSLAEKGSLLGENADLPHRRAL